MLPLVVVLVWVRLQAFRMNDLMGNYHLLRAFAILVRTEAEVGVTWFGR